MTARMHEAFYLRPIRRTGLLLNGQGVDVCTESDNRMAGSNFDEHADSVRTDLRIEAVLPECFGDPVRGSAFGPCDLGMTVQITPHSNGIGRHGTRMSSYKCGEIGHLMGLYGLVVSVLSTLRGQEDL
jgi:hypothetical protein